MISVYSLINITLSNKNVSPPDEKFCLNVRKKRNISLMEYDLQDPELDALLSHMSPNERQRFIEETRKKLRQQRIIESKKAYSQMTKGFTAKYSKQKEIHDKKHKGKKSAAELAEVKQQIDELNKRIEARQKTIGQAYVTAVENENEEQERLERNRLLEMKRKQEAKDRFNDALIYTRQNDPNIPIQMRNERIIAAKDVARQLENKNVQKHAVVKAKQAEEERRQQQLYEQEEKDKFRPKLRIEDYACTYTHAGIGIVPVNKGAEIYQQQLETQEQKDKELEHQRFISKRKRTKAALNDTKFEQDVNLLEKELGLIEQCEVNQSLKAIADGTSKVREQYNFEQKRQRHQAYMRKEFLAYDDEPKPKGPSPQPIARDFPISSSFTTSSTLSNV